MSRYGNDKVKHNFYRNGKRLKLDTLCLLLAIFFHLKWKYMYKLWTGFSVIITTKLIYRYRYICRSVSINDVRPIMHLCLPLVSASKKGPCVEYLAYNSSYFNVRARTDARTKYRIFVYKCAECKLPRGWRTARAVCAENNNKFEQSRLLCALPKPVYLAVLWRGILWSWTQPINT